MEPESANPETLMGSSTAKIGTIKHLTQLKWMLTLDVVKNETLSSGGTRILDMGKWGGGEVANGSQKKLSEGKNFERSAVERKTPA